MSETALIVKVPEAESLVGALRDRFDPVARLGVPAHVTILYPFIALTIRVAEAFPEFPPYGGEFGTIAPHLTVARGEEPQLHALEQALNAEPRLQAGGRARCATLALIENSSGRWRDMHGFALSP